MAARTSKKNELTVDVEVREHRSEGLWYWRATLNDPNADRLTPVAVGGWSETRAGAEDIGQVKGRELLVRRIEETGPWTTVTTITQADV